MEGTPDCASATTHRRSLRTKRPQQPRSSCASTSHYNGLKIASLLLRVHSGYPPGMVPDMHRRGIYIAPRWGCCFNRGRDLLRSTELDCPSAAAGRRASPQLAVRPNCALWGSAPASGSLGRRGVPAPGEDNRCAVFIMVRTLGNSHYTLRARRFVKPPCHVTCYCVAVDLYVSTSPPPDPRLRPRVRWHPARDGRRPRRRSSIPACAAVWLSLSCWTAASASVSLISHVASSAYLPAPRAKHTR